MEHRYASFDSLDNLVVYCSRAMKILVDMQKRVELFILRIHGKSLQSINY